jgi:hypothetical protein
MVRYVNDSLPRQWRKLKGGRVWAARASSLDARGKTSKPRVTFASHFPGGSAQVVKNDNLI